MKTLLSLRLWRDALKTWSNAEADQYSAAVAYFVPFALTPLVFVSIGWIGLIIGADELIALLSQWGRVIDPGLPDLIATAMSQFGVITNAYAIPLIATLFFSMMILVALNSVTAGLHALWGIERSGWRSFFVRYGRALLFVILLQIYLVFIILVSRFITGLAAVTTIESLLWLNPVVVFVSTVLLIAVGYGLLPLWAPSLKARLVGAFIAGLFFTIARFLVAFHFATAPTATLFGAATIVVVLLVWFYVGASIIFYGAAVAKVYDVAERLKQ